MCSVFDHMCLSIFFNCGHLICNFCYIRHFENNHCKRLDDYYTNCPKCNAFSKPQEVLPITAQLIIRSNSKISTAIKQALVKCDNSCCDQLISLDNWVNHVKYDCPNRIVQCPARNCPFIGPVDYVTTHSIQCPLHCVWCAGCKMNWTVLATNHNCEKTNEYAKLTNTPIYRQLPEPEDGSLFLPYHAYNEEPFDIIALKKINELILKYRSEDVVSSILTHPNSVTLPRRVTRSQTFNHINEETQFPN